MAAGADGIVISNHGTYSECEINGGHQSQFEKGGRQVDGALASLDALAIIMKDTGIVQAQRSGRLTIFFDSGIRSGSDIVSAQNAQFFHLMSFADKSDCFGS